VNVKKMLRVGAAVVTASLAFGAGAAHATNPPPVGGCGNGLDLFFSPAFEEIVASSTQGHVNGDGWVCLNRSGLDNSNGHFNLVVVIDNTVPL
jgi:hypothetical protein